MDGMHDLGGKQGFGRIGYPAAAHAETWEPLVRALSALAVREKIYTMDEYRHAIERMAPVHYLTAPYYERVLTALATLLVEKGVVTAEDLSARVEGAFPLAQPLGAGRVSAPARAFAIGEAVRVKNQCVSGHTRAPAYIRGKTGVVIAISPPYPYPDAAAHGVPAAREPTYDVRFRATDLWPDSADEALVHVGVFQSYLESAD